MKNIRFYTLVITCFFSFSVLSQTNNDNLKTYEFSYIWGNTLDDGKDYFFNQPSTIILDDNKSLFLLHYTDKNNQTVDAMVYYFALKEPFANSVSGSFALGYMKDDFRLTRTGGVTFIYSEGQITGVCLSFNYPSYEPGQTKIIQENLTVSTSKPYGK